MKTLKLLEDKDKIQPGDWYRPLIIVSGNGGMSDSYFFTNTYSGDPENNAKWLQVKQTIGKPWWGKTVGEFCEAVEMPYEFVRGRMPKSHQYGPTSAEALKLAEAGFEKALKDVITGGKYITKTWSWVRENDSKYFVWAQREGYAPLTPKQRS